MKFQTIYDIIEYIENKYPHLQIYNSDTFFTAYRIPLHIWEKTVDIPISTITILNENLQQGKISISDNIDIV
jgi:hypothetical protein